MNKQTEDKRKQRPILYSFRRCPYAMRARLAIMISGVECELREVVLKDKPQAMLTVSPKGTVPVLLSGDGVIEESAEIAYWALSKNDPEYWLTHPIDHPLIQKADTEFKSQLDRYKYADRYPEHTQQYYFEQAKRFLFELEQSLSGANNSSQPAFLLSENATVLDAMIFPFVRQFAFVNKEQFDALPIPKLHVWLDYWLDSLLFKSIMLKYSPWKASSAEGQNSVNDSVVVFGGDSTGSHS